MCYISTINRIFKKINGFLRGPLATLLIFNDPCYLFWYHQKLLILTLIGRFVAPVIFLILALLY